MLLLQDQKQRRECWAPLSRSEVQAVRNELARRQTSRRRELPADAKQACVSAALEAFGDAEEQQQVKVKSSTSQDVDATTRAAEHTA